jgi:hypothetical protein
VRAQGASKSTTMGEKDVGKMNFNHKVKKIAGCNCAFAG